MVENPITESMIETGLRSGAITVENDCGELVAHIGDGYVYCGDLPGDETPEPLSTAGTIYDVLCGFAKDEDLDNGFADELSYYFAYLSEVNPADASTESLDDLMEQKVEDYRAGRLETVTLNDLEESLGLSNDER